MCDQHSKTRTQVLYLPAEGQITMVCIRDGSRISRRGWICFGGRGATKRALFGENVCEIERTGSSRRGGRVPENFVCRSANVYCLQTNRLNSASV